MAKSCLTFAMVPFNPQQAVEVEREDSGEVEEEGEVDLPHTVLPPFKCRSELTLPAVVSGVLNQLAPVECVAKSGAIEMIANEGYDGRMSLKR